MVQPHRGLWVTDPSAFQFDDRVMELPGTSKRPVAARWVLRLSGFILFPLQCRGPSALALDAPDPHDGAKLITGSVLYIDGGYHIID